MVFSVINQHLIFRLDQGSEPEEISEETSKDILERMDGLVDTIMPVAGETPVRVINTVSNAGIRFATVCANEN